MSVNSIGFLGGYSYGNSGLSEETKQRLLALGIEPSTVVSEAQAKILIENILKIQSVNKSVSSQASYTCTSECELLSRAKRLAYKMGVTISEDMAAEEIIAAISATINKKLSVPNQSNQTLSVIKNCQEELSSIKSEFSIVKQNENAMFASMNFNANINKMMLGLN